MLISDLWQETYSAITANKARSGLTILGIIIGIGSVISMISIGKGAQSSIEANIQSIGSNLIMVTPGAQKTFGGGASLGRGSSQTLTLADAEAVSSEVMGINAVAEENSRRYQITFKKNNTNTQVVGTVPSYLQVRNLEIANGTFFSEKEIKSLAKVAILGSTTLTDLFGEDSDYLGKMIRINGIDFKVIGATKSKGGTGFGNQDDMVFIPLSTAQRYLSNDNYVSTIYIQAQDSKNFSLVQQEITNLLLVRHKIKNPENADFQTINQADIVATASSVTGTFTSLLAAIAGISLIVGGIGIMNMMLTIVTERTREIGLRKAIGAKKADINNQFLVESISLTFIGGFLGIIFGWVVSKIISGFAGLTTVISISSILLAFGVSAAIGIIFGYYPARRASRLNPIEALRYE